MYFRSLLSVSLIHQGINYCNLMSAVFQARLDILGMVIYATEFVLWCGVFACGGYFNLLPWLRQKRRKRSTMEAETETGNMSSDSRVGERNEGGNGVSHAIELRRVPSSTSVFRTPSSVLSIRTSTHS